MNKMDREKLDNWCEKGILALVLGILVIGPLALGAADVWQFLMLQGLTLVVVLLWGIRLWASPRPQLLWPPICWAVLAFVAYATVRYLQSDVEYVARLELIKILTYAFLFFAILNNRDEFPDVRVQLTYPATEFVSIISPISLRVRTLIHQYFAISY